jgi:hypothetical protein
MFFLCAEVTDLNENMMAHKTGYKQKKNHKLVKP